MLEEKFDVIRWFLMLVGDELTLQTQEKGFRMYIPFSLFLVLLIKIHTLTTQKVWKH